MLLYVGMLTDTGSFHYSNTTPVVHTAVAELLKYGLDPKEIYKKVYESISVKDACLFLSLLPTIQFTAKGKIAWFELDEAHIRDNQLSLDLNDSLFRFARSIRGVDVAVVFRKGRRSKDGTKVKISLRSQGKVDVNAIANYFGGGGHASASGANLRGDFKTITRKVISVIRTKL